MTLDMLYDRRALKKVEKPPDYPYDDTTWYEAPNGIWFMKVDLASRGV